TAPCVTSIASASLACVTPWQDIHVSRLRIFITFGIARLQYTTYYLRQSIGQGGQKGTAHEVRQNPNRLRAAGLERAAAQGQQVRVPGRLDHGRDVRCRGHARLSGGHAMSLHRRNAKRDASEPAIVEYLRHRGALVERISGAGIPDLLVGWCGRWILL